MSEDELIGYTEILLDANGLWDWDVVVNDQVVSDYTGEQLGGACVWSQKQIRFNRRFVSTNPNDAGWYDLARHEVAHALTPEDLRHGEIFQAAWDRLRATLMEVRTRGTNPGSQTSTHSR